MKYKYIGTEEQFNERFLDVVYELDNEEERDVLISLCEQMGYNTKYANDTYSHPFEKTNLWNDVRLYKLQSKFKSLSWRYCDVSKYTPRKLNIQDLIDAKLVEVIA